MTQANLCEINPFLVHIAQNYPQALDQPSFIIYGYAMQQLPYPKFE